MNMLLVTMSVMLEVIKLAALALHQDMVDLK